MFVVTKSQFLTKNMLQWRNSNFVAKSVTNSGSFCDETEIRH